MNLRLNVVLVALVLLGLVLTACGTTIGATPTPTAKPTVAATATVPPTVPVVPTSPPPPTVAPTATPVPPTATATPVPPKVTSKQLVNVRQGPGTNFSVAAQMPANTNTVALGKNEDGTWLQVAYPDASRPGWVSATFVTVTGSIDKLPVIAVAAPPTSTPGAAPTKAAVATAVPTQAFPPAKGTMGFVSFSVQQNSWSLNNLFVNPRDYSGAYLLGRNPVDLRISTNAAPFAWSPDGSRVAFVYGPNGLTDVLRVTNTAGEPRDLVGHGSLSAAGGISSPSWLPDGNTIGYIGIDNNYAAQAIFTINAGGGTENRFFTPRSGETFRGLAWGKTWILFVSNLTGAHEVWRLNSDGSGPLQLTNDKRENGSPAWSPDGKSFAYYSKRADNSYQIMVMNSDGTGARQLTNTANNWSPTWSPDGNWIAFSSTRGGRLDVYIMDKNGGNVQLVTDKFGAEGQLPGSWR
jgi:Tol biopolymer transport system component/uncharacterized protein YraI